MSSRSFCVTLPCNEQCVVTASEWYSSVLVRLVTVYTVCVSYNEDDCLLSSFFDEFVLAFCVGGVGMREDSLLVIVVGIV